MYKRDADTVDHLLIHCPVAWELWTTMISWFVIRWALSRNVMELLIAWKGAKVGKKRKRVWNLIPLSLMWIIWRERNSRCFEGVEKSLRSIKSFVVNSLYI
ncbi:hypothetical protein RHMOL_Rhmol06G0291500 [Rhododendron molle]|uniref:Uncharacterized protein n=1 Tax=Rhododendron molle TaxID=49168 RepID=A0ACC0NIC0_RHOML|nr:hypothetical protein RHMOL_Rhmol06G0291500 [Rhododendron molle]